MLEVRKKIITRCGDVMDGVIYDVLKYDGWFDDVVMW